MIIDIPGTPLSARVRAYINQSQQTLIRVASTSSTWSRVSWELKAGRRVRMVASLKGTAAGEEQQPAYAEGVVFITEVSPAVPMGNFGASGTMIGDVLMFIGDTVTACASDGYLELSLASVGGGNAVIDLYLAWASS